MGSSPLVSTTYPATDWLRDFCFSRNNTHLFNKTDKQTYINNIKAYDYLLILRKGEVIMKGFQVLKDFGVCVLCAIPLILYALFFVLIA